METGKAIVGEMPDKGDTCTVFFLSDDEEFRVKILIYKKDIETWFYNIKEEYIFKKGITAYYSKESGKFDTEAWRNHCMISAFSGADFQYSYKFC